MAQVTTDFALRMLGHARRLEHSPLTVHEEEQLAYAWLCLDMIRGMAHDGEWEALLGYLTSPEKMARAFQAQYREGTEQP